MIASEAPLLGRRRAVDEKRKQPLLHDRRLLLVPALVLARVLLLVALIQGLVQGGSWASGAAEACRTIGKGRSSRLRPLEPSRLPFQLRRR